MSAAPALEPAGVENGPRRNSLRHAINVALDVITLRSGIPDSIPGRCTDLSEAGIGAVVAGELKPNQHVAIELKLPQVALPLRARVIVRYHTQFRCGLQFMNLTAEQREMIRYWVVRSTPEPTPASVCGEDQEVTSIAPATTPPKQKGRRKIRIGKRSLLVLLIFALALAAFGWWYWQKAWKELERSASITAAEPLEQL